MYRLDDIHSTTIGVKCYFDGVPRFLPSRAAEMFNLPTFEHFWFIKSHVTHPLSKYLHHTLFTWWPLLWGIVRNFTVPWSGYSWSSVLLSEDGMWLCRRCWISVPLQTTKTRRVWRRCITVYWTLRRQHSACRWCCMTELRLNTQTLPAGQNFIRSIACCFL